MPLFRSLLFVLIATASAFANLTNMPPGYTGAPGDPGSCVSCHTAVPNATRGVDVSFGATLAYRPGERKTIIVQFQSGEVTGLQITARTAQNAAAGTFQASPVTTVSTRAGLSYLSHQFQEPRRRWIFSWTAPASDAGEIRFYLSAVSGNGDGGAGGDQVHNLIFVLLPRYVQVPGGYRQETVPVPFPFEQRPRAITNDGRIVGTYFTGTRTLGFLTNPDGSTATIEVPGSESTFPLGINSSGAMVGYAVINGSPRGFLRRPDGTVSLFQSPGAFGTEITAIRHDGEMTGAIQQQNHGERQGVRLNPALAVTRQFPGYPTGFNASGTIAGTRTPGFGPVFLDTPLGYTEIPLFGVSALGLNDRQDVVAAIFAPRTMVSPGVQESYLIPSDGRQIRLGYPSVSAINNQGHIVGLDPTFRSVRLVPCPAAAATNRLDISPDAGSVSVNVTAEPGCAWIDHSDADWLTLGTRGTGSGTYTFQVTRNQEPAARTAWLTLGDTVITVNQPVHPVSCIFSVTPPSVQLPVSGGSGEVTISGPAGCIPPVRSDASWIDRSDTPTGFRYRVFDNPNPNVRTGIVQVGNAQFTVQQAAGVCSFSTGPPGGPVAAAGGSFGVDMFTGGECPWTATSDQPWLVPQRASGQGSLVIRFDFTANPDTANRSATVRIGTSSFVVTQYGTAAALRFVPVTPCRLVDTRTGSGKTGAFGPPRLPAGAARDFSIPAAGCGIPDSARAYALNFTIVPPGYLGYITAWAAGQPRPATSLSNSWNGRVVANSAIVPAGANGAISVFASDDTELVLDITGFFAPAGSAPTGLAFYSLTPCRAVDTRGPANPFIPVGGPTLTAGTARTLPLAGNCSVPASARAVWANVTAVPPGPLPFVTLYPAGQPQPPVSALNSFDGQVVANAAVLPLGNGGAVSAFGAAGTDLLLDVYGYFAPPGGIDALHFHSMPPCRLADTRAAGGRLESNQVRTFAATSSPCSIPLTARALSLQITAVPAGYLGFVYEFSRPSTSLLNSWNGQVVSNAAVLSSTLSIRDNISLGVSDPAHLILDVNGYFAP